MQMKILTNNSKRKLPSKWFMAIDASQATRRVTVWPLVVLLLISDIIGAGILELPSNMAKVGWLLGGVLLLAGAPLNVYTGVKLAQLQRIYPAARTYGELAGALLGYPVGIFVAVLVYTNLTLTLGAYMLVLTRSVQAIFNEVELCQVTAALIVCCLLTPFTQIKTLHGIAVLSLIGFFAVLVSIAMCLAWAWFGADSRWQNESHEIVSSDLHFFSIPAALSGFTFAYAGQSIYLEIMSEMKTPRLFSRALYVSTPILVIAYVTVAFTGYAVAGEFKYFYREYD